MTPRIQEACTEVNRTEESYTEEACAEEACTEDIPAEIEFFITLMASFLLQRRVTAEDIYEGMLEANCGDEDVATFIRDKAILEFNQMKQSCGLCDPKNN